MSTSLQDVKDRLFDLDCPDLLDDNDDLSPTCSSSSSSIFFQAPSPSQDAKEMILSDQGLSLFSPANLSPLSNYGFADVQCNSESSLVWPVAPTVSQYPRPQQQCFDSLASSQALGSVPCSSSQSVPTGTWIYSQFPSSQPLLTSNVRPQAMMPQPQAQLQFQVQPPPQPYNMNWRPQQDVTSVMTSTPPSVEVFQTLPASFIGYNESGLVVPGHLFDTPLDRFTYSNPAPSLSDASTLLSSTTTTTTPPLADPTSSSFSTATTEEEATTEPASAPEVVRNAKDDYLQEARRRGLSYKEIKRRGNFTEAESTLRGRIRILSKPKEMRVRKPQWQRSDVCLSFIPVLPLNILVFLSSPLTSSSSASSHLFLSNVHPLFPLTLIISFANSHRSSSSTAPSPP